MGLQVVDYSVIGNGNQLKYRRYPNALSRPCILATRKYIRLASMVIIALGVSACSVSGPKVSTLESDASLVTNSVAKPTQIAGIEKTDAEVIKSTVVAANPKPKSSLALAWANPDTGSSGTITAIDKFLGNHGQKCRGFKTTVSTFMGISFYNGEACQISPSEWVLSWFKPVEIKS